MNALLHAVAFLTRIPVPRLSADPKDWQRSVAFYPIVGVLLGILLWGVALLTGWLLPVPLAAVLTLVFWVYSTGALHLDGWMDLADGLGSWREREKIFAIMKDSRVGAMGVIAAILLFMVKVSALYEIMRNDAEIWLLLPSLFARMSLVAAIWFWPYVSEKGIGTGLKGGLTAWKVGFGFIFVLCATVVLLSWKGMLAFLAVTLASWIFLRSISRRLGGLTGDCYGALVEWTEAVTLVVLIATGRLWM
ncbi:adenosylcobinamide-GDP ribazoletransferase [Aneurinibacillus aneurinilyticus]|uniref:Adenosylcobinamide-GDP ribazoletransferase n=2 Tax=Aneurinibacillus aneurinilyticus TaxID=1391 RepID=A0A848CXB7_ANEAE|nr:adenosylcobinamide-GDP ribazoletransferase [Aneurinibacillus aneurinilyticus]ERI07703.1 adenosylcobinamide-GDP ribazoletransferase [Aneurinibacillus aneurinilyticus ATCC 12856]MED0705621.1 adenosylcobinamide-GDP ribazoletransferase [Aneurinibacillus aneurinilyticus]MED0724512.1 adenosylcobinamide-GDP ribazoletransferase [Aneurinibacillus aneurinilyticus]MED0731347.1 adenosylcobinamide-GDP ribazoletransferase [Aneurinibacillus aneurinilyticus]MED0739381.1 adenosylcobinamide-GDP ribazoletrans